MRSLFTAALFLIAGIANGSDNALIQPEELEDIVVSVTKAQNDAFRSGATSAHADALFALFTDDFVYEHEQYGGVYSREVLYNNTLRLISNGGDQRSDDRYTIVNLIPGRNAVVAVRLTREGDRHLSVFEFSGRKVSKIKEYW